MVGVGEAGEVAGFGDEYRGQGGLDAVKALDRSMTVMVVWQLVDQAACRRGAATGMGIMWVVWC